MLARSILLALAVFAMPAAALAAVPPDLAKPESLCPGIGLPDLEFGKDERSQSKATLDALRQTSPNGQGEAGFTNWSGRLYAVEWRMPTDDAAASLVWRNGVEDWLSANGWTPVELPELKSLQSMYPSMAQKTVNGRTLVIEYDTPGIQLLRCADRELLEINTRELEGKLAPGSPRPLAPAAPSQPFRLPERSQCDRPDFIAAFASTKVTTEIGPTIERHFPVDDPARDEADYERRLNTWLKWKMLSDGRLSEERLWDLDTTQAESRASIDRTMALIEVLGNAADAQEQGDGRKLCLASIDMIAKMHSDSEHQAAAHRAVNGRLLAEARRLGIAVD